MLNGAASLQDQHPQLSSCRRHALEVEDSKEANLLSSLPAAVGFITAALEGGGGSARVLVHCAQGVSRSAAVAAAYLMAASAGAAGGGPGGLDPDAALAALRRACPAAAPNAGFVAQLELFHAMGCRLQDGYVPYKRFLLQQASGRPRPRCGDLPRARSAGPRSVGPACCGMRGRPAASLQALEPAPDGRFKYSAAKPASTAPAVSLGAPFQLQAANHYQETGALPAAEALPVPAEPAGGGAALYRCRKCRCLVATSHNVVETEQVRGWRRFWA